MSTATVETMPLGEYAARLQEALRIRLDVERRMTVVCTTPGLIWAEVTRSRGAGKPWECGQDGARWVCTCPAARTWHRGEVCKHIAVLQALLEA